MPNDSSSAAQLSVVRTPAPVKLMIFDLDDCLAMTNKHLRHYLNLSFMEQFSEEKMADLLACKGTSVAVDAHNRHFLLADKLNLSGLEGTFGCSAENAANLMGGQLAGYDRDWIEGCYKTMADGFIADIVDHVPKNPLLRAQMEALIAHGWTLAVLTQGRRDYAGAVLEHLNVLDLFHDQLILGRAEVNFVSKKRGTPYHDLLRRVTAVMGEPEVTWMIEDSIANLEPTVQMGFNTALVGKATPPYWMDAQEVNINALLENLLARHDI